MTHLYLSIKTCPVCQQALKERYRKDRTIRSLQGPIYLMSHVSSCENGRCANYHQGILPEAETLLGIKGYKFGLDACLSRKKKLTMANSEQDPNTAYAKGQVNPRRAGVNLTTA